MPCPRPKDSGSRSNPTRAAAGILLEEDEKSEVGFIATRLAQPFRSSFQTGNSSGITELQPIDCVSREALH